MNILKYSVPPGAVFTAEFPRWNWSMEIVILWYSLIIASVAVSSFLSHLEQSQYRMKDTMKIIVIFLLSLIRGFV